MTTRPFASNWPLCILIVATDDAGSADIDPGDFLDQKYYSYYGPGGQCSVTGYQGNGFKLSHDEVRVITAIDGRQVSWAEPLEYAHVVTTGDLPRNLRDNSGRNDTGDRTVTVKPCIAMLSYSVRFRSATADDIYPADYPDTTKRGAPLGDLADRQKRGHIMFMHSDDVQVRYCESYNMGRTDTVLDLESNQTTNEGDRRCIATKKPSEGGVLIIDWTNVRARYAWHTHGAGPFLSKRMVVFSNLSAWADPDAPPIPGWAMTQHNSRAAFEHCTIYNVRGAGMVSENGNEIGQWVGNTVAWCRGDGHNIFYDTAQMGGGNRRFGAYRRRGGELRPLAGEHGERNADHAYPHRRAAEQPEHGVRDTFRRDQPSGDQP